MSLRVGCFPSRTTSQTEDLVNDVDGPRGIYAGQARAAHPTGTEVIERQCVSHEAIQKL